MKNMFRRMAAIVLCLTMLVLSASALSVEQALELLEQHYLRDIPAEAYRASSLAELFQLLGDRYTYYMTTEEYASFLAGLEGSDSQGDIGVSISLTAQGILIQEAVSGGSAQAAGLQSGDLIIAVDGVSCVPAAAEHQAMISGKAGTSVTLRVKRKDGSTQNYTLIRRVIASSNTKAELVDGHVGYITCTSFGSDTGEQFAQSIRQHDAQADSWIVDLRGNIGGITTSAVTALGAFIGPGRHLYLQNGNGDVYYYSHDGQALSGEPVVVLTDSRTASAAEAFAADIRDKDAGIIVGTRTYGKGEAQLLLTEEESSYFNGDAMRVTAYRFYSTGGNTTDMIGVIPTLIVSEQDAPGVARALSGSQGNGAGNLTVELAGKYFTVELDKTDSATLSALFAALPPSARLWMNGDKAYTVAQAAAELSVSYDSRWFRDLADCDYADEINTLASCYLLLGDGTGDFLPTTQLTRAQICAMLAQLLGVSYTGASRFDDVADSAWYADEVNAMASLGLIEGDGSGRFFPDQVLTQEQYYTILGRMVCFFNLNVNNFAKKLTVDELALLSGYSDWAREGAAVLAWSAQSVLGQSGSMLLDKPEALSPGAPILREEAAACLYRMLSLTGILSV